MADTIWGEYGRALTVDFELWETDGTDFQLGAVHASGDTTIMRDEAAVVNTTNGFVDEGTGYSILVSAAEMAAARIKLYVIDQGTKAWLDKTIRVLTHSHPLAHDPRGVIAAGTAQAGDATTLTLAAGESAVDDFFVGGVLEIISGTGGGQTPRVITDYVGMSKVATVAPNWAVTPDATSVYRVYSVPPSAGLVPDVLQALADYDAADNSAVAQVSTDISTLIGTPAGVDVSADIAAVQADTDNLQTRLPTALSSGGHMTVDIQTIKENALTGTPPFNTV